MKCNYLIYGNDNYLINYNIKKILKTKKDEEITKTVYDMNEVTIEEVLDDINTFDLFNNLKIVICENATFLSSEAKKDNQNADLLVEYLEKANNDNILIISYNGDIDERKKIVKILKKNSTVIKCDKLNDNEIISFIKNKLNKSGYKISNINLFIERTGNDLQIINNELTKLMYYKLEEKIITDEDIINLVPKKMDDNIFELIDAVVIKDTKKIFELYDIMTNYYNEEPTKIIIMVANQFRLILQTKLLNKKGLTEQEIAKNLKVHPYRVKLAFQKGKNISTQKLEQYLLSLANLDLDIKMGKQNKNKALEIFFLNM